MLAAGVAVDPALRPPARLPARLVRPAARAAELGAIGSRRAFPCRWSALGLFARMGAGAGARRRAPALPALIREEGGELGNAGACRGGAALRFRRRRASRASRRPSSRRGVTGPLVIDPPRCRRRHVSPAGSSSARVSELQDSPSSAARTESRRRRRDVVLDGVRVARRVPRRDPRPPRLSDAQTATTRAAGPYAQGIDISFAIDKEMRR